MFAEVLLNVSQEEISSCVAISAVISRVFPALRHFFAPSGEVLATSKEKQQRQKWWLITESKHSNSNLTVGGLITLIVVPSPLPKAHSERGKNLISLYVVYVMLFFNFIYTLIYCMLYSACTELQIMYSVETWSRSFHIQLVVPG